MSSTKFLAISTRLNPLNRFAEARSAQLKIAAPILGAQEAEFEPTVPKDIDPFTPLSGMLIAAIVAALLVVAEQLISTWADGHLLVVWVSLWMVVFTALALFMPSLRNVARAHHTVLPGSQDPHEPN